MQIFGQNFQFFLAPPEVKKHNPSPLPPKNSNATFEKIGSKKSGKKIFREWIVYSKYSILKFLMLLPSPTSTGGYMLLIFKL